MTVIKINEQNEFERYSNVRQEFPSTIFPANLKAEHLPDGYKELHYEPVINIENKIATYSSIPVFKDNRWVVEIIYSDTPIIIPDSITPLQAELQLLKMELLDDVLELLKLDREAKIYWDRATQFLRYDPILLKMAKIINMSDEKLDELFINAKKIQ